MRIRLAMIILFGTMFSPRGVATTPMQTTFSGGTANGSYVGKALVVDAGPGKARGYGHGSLVSGTDVARATSLRTFIATQYGLLGCDAVLTPGGQINMSCSN